MPNLLQIRWLITVNQGQPATFALEQETLDHSQAKHGWQWTAV